MFWDKQVMEQEIDEEKILSCLMVLIFTCFLLFITNMGKNFVTLTYLAVWETGMNPALELVVSRVRDVWPPKVPHGSEVTSGRQLQGRR